MHFFCKAPYCILILIAAGSNGLRPPRRVRMMPFLAGGRSSGCSPMGSIFLIAYFDLHFESRAKLIEDLHETIDCRPPEIRIADAGEVGGGDPGAIVSCAHAELVPIERLDNLGSQTRSEERRVGKEC